MNYKPWLIVNVVIWVSVGIYFINPNRLSIELPVKISDQEDRYQVPSSWAKEKWNHDNILAEPRLTFLLANEANADGVSVNEGSIDEGIYSLRLNGSDLRQVIPLNDLEETIARSLTQETQGSDVDSGVDDSRSELSLIKNESALKRSTSNRYLSMVHRKGDSDYLIVLDLQKDTGQLIAKLDKVNSYDWLDGKDQLFYVASGRRLMVFDLTNNEKQDITDRFRLYEAATKYELYPQLNKLGVINQHGFAAYNFETGALLERSKERSFISMPASNPIYRYDYQYSYEMIDNEPIEFAYPLFFLAANPQSIYRVPFKVDLERPIVEFGPDYVYQSKGNEIRFYNGDLSLSGAWVVDGHLSVKNLSMSPFKPKVYEAIYCRGETKVYWNVSEQLFDACGLRMGWDHPLPKKKVGK